MKGTPNLRLNYPKAPPSPANAPMFDFDGGVDLNMTTDFLGKDMFTYISEINDPDVANILCTLAIERVKVTFATLDLAVKSAWSACQVIPDYATTFKHEFGTSGKLRQEFMAGVNKNGANEMKILTEFVTKLAQYKKSKDEYESRLNNELKQATNLSIQSIADQLKELVDYNQHTIRRKNFKKRVEPIPAVQSITECYNIKHFDSMHHEKVNCVDICPYNKLLASGSSDGTIKFVDLEDMKQFKEMTIQEPHKKGIYSLTIDDNHNIAYINESNLLRVINLSLNHCTFTYQGHTLTELTDEIPDQAIQYTADYRHLVFRGGAKQIVFFQAKNNFALEKVVDTKDKIRDFSISATCDYLATASYEALETVVYDTKTGGVISHHKFDVPIFTVQWAPNGIHLVFGAGNGKVILVEFAKYHDKSLRVQHVFDTMFSVCSNISGISISSDSQYVAVGARNGDYRVRVLNLWERREQVPLQENLHTYNVQAVRFSKNAKFLSTCSEDTTVKVLLLR